MFVGEAIETYKQNVISRPMPKIIFGIVADNNRKSLVFVNVRLYFAFYLFVERERPGGRVVSIHG